MGAERRQIISACLLLDWHNILRHIDPDFALDPRRKFPAVFLKIQQAVAKLLTQESAAVGYRVTTRLYHGWHNGREATPIRRTLEEFSVLDDSARRLGRVSFAPGFQFGNELACGTHRNPLFSTLRSGGQERGQKMIDTAISCDLLHLLRTGAADIAIVASDDDDMIPAVFTAEAWNFRVLLLRELGHDLAHVTQSDCRRLLKHWDAP